MLVALEADETAVARLAAAVARDVTGDAEPSPATVAEAGDALAWLLASLRAGPLPAKERSCPKCRSNSVRHLKKRRPPKESS